MRIRMFTLTFLMFAMIAGCSGGYDPVSVEPCGPVIHGTSHTLWALYDLTINTETGEAEAIASRAALSHINITFLVTPPKCYDCMEFEVIEHNTATRCLRLKVTLRNKTQVSGYDVRGVFIPKVDGVRLTNADSYTELWGACGYSARNPYRMFAQGVPNHEFPPQFYDYRTYRINYPTPDTLMKITYAVDVSWPDNCEEPPGIQLPVDTPVIEGSGYGTIDVEVIDWQDNIEYVRIHPYPIHLDSFNATLDMTYMGGDMYRANFPNSNGAMAAFYELWVEAKSLGSDIITWNKVKVLVDVDEPPPATEIKDMDVCFYVAKYYDGSLPEQPVGMGPNIPFTLSVATSQAMWCNKFWNKYGYNLVVPGNYEIMDKNGSADCEYYFLDSSAEALAMHEAYGKKYTPDAVNVYFVQTIQGSIQTACCVIPSPITSLGLHKSENIFVIVGPKVWNYEEVLAHECGHAFGSLIDIYLLQPAYGIGCVELLNAMPPNAQHLYCDDQAIYQGNLMYYAMGWEIEEYTITQGQWDFVDLFHQTYPNNW